MMRNMQSQFKKVMNKDNSDKHNKSGPRTRRCTSIFDIDDDDIGEVQLSEDSDSSSENFPKTPDVLTDSFLKVHKLQESQDDQKRKKKITTESENKKVEECEFYDFSEILKSQNEVKLLAEKLSNQPVTSRPPKLHGRTKVNSIQSDSVNQLGISDLLKIGENIGNSSKDNVEDTSDKEETEEEHFSRSKEETGGLESVEITIKEPTLFNRSKDKQKNALETEFKRLFNTKRKAYQLLLHKTHLLCLIASGTYMNDAASCTKLLALALSLIPSNKFFPPEKTTRVYVVKLVSWFSSKINVSLVNKEHAQLKQQLTDDIVTCVSRSDKHKVLFFILVARVLGLHCRLVMNLNPVPIRPPTENVPEIEHLQKKESDKLTAKKIKKSKSKQTSNVTTRKDTISKQNLTNTKRKVLSSDEDDVFESSVKKMAVDKVTKSKILIWSEIYLEAEDKWISVDIIRNCVGCDEVIYNDCSHPVSYIFAWNADKTIKDVTRRYTSEWHICLKTRVSADWLNSTLQFWTPPLNQMNEQENQQLERKLEEMPFPKTIAGFKDHPLYALKRHLLKFEAIFPPTAVPLGSLKGEAIYSRVCVVELHAKEYWMRKGKVVRPDQEPYKIVKARPKLEKGTGKVIKDLPLSLYGYWQVDDYIPPNAVDGKVPRNDFGNVELYKPSMLPKGTIHLQLPGMMRVARKLDIDCAHAVVGWEFRKNGSYPVLDGVVVCEEFKVQLLDAWNKGIDESAKRNKESRTKRAISNWYKFVRTLQLRNKLKVKYKFKFNGTGETKKKGKK